MGGLFGRAFEHRGVRSRWPLVASFFFADLAHSRGHGRDERGKLVLNRRDLRSLLNAVRDLQRVVIKALDKGGLVVVETNGALITTYNVDSFNPDRAYGH